MNSVFWALGISTDDEFCTTCQVRDDFETKASGSISKYDTNQRLEALEVGISICARRVESAFLEGRTAMTEDDDAIQEYSRSGNNVQLGGVSSSKSELQSTNIRKWVRFVGVPLKRVSYSSRCMSWED
ncbi:hypothetical protein XPA_000594 [Xanthoria parietina]